MCACSDANQIIFRVKSEKAPAPASIKKLLLVLLAEMTIGCNIENNKTDREDDKHRQVLGILEFATHSDRTKTNVLAFYDDRCWLRISTLQTLHVKESKY